MVEERGGEADLGGDQDLEGGASAGDRRGTSFG